jgi:hypothetical protein
MLSDAGQYSAGAKSRDPGLPGEAGNGRVGVYPASGGNPVIGRFLSPDPFIQSPDFTQSYNNYSYCVNNPLKYFDASGFTYSNNDNESFGDPNHYTLEQMWAMVFGAMGYDLPPSLESGAAGRREKEEINDSKHKYRVVVLKDIYGKEKVFLIPFKESEKDDIIISSTSIGFAVSKELFYSSIFKTWMGANYQIYNLSFTGNGITGGRNAFGKSVSKAFGIAGNMLGVINYIRINEEARNGAIDKETARKEQIWNAVTTAGAQYGAAIGLGRFLSQIIISTDTYQFLKFQYWYNQAEKRFGPICDDNEYLWFNFLDNYGK